MYKEQFASRIKNARIKTGFTQLEVAKETGIDDSNISKYENGKLEPSIETLGILANFYEVSVDWLLGLGIQPGGRPYYDRTNDKEVQEIIRK